MSFDQEPLMAEVGPRVDPATGKPATLAERQRARIAAGLHPLSGVGQVPRRIPLAPEGTGTCGTCALKMRPAHQGRPYPKCSAGEFTIDHPRDGGGTWTETVWPRAAHSDATDVRSWWPACTAYEPRESTCSAPE